VEGPAVLLPNRLFGQIPYSLDLNHVPVSADAAMRSRVGLRNAIFMASVILVFAHAARTTKHCQIGVKEKAMPASASEDLSVGMTVQIDADIKRQIDDFCSETGADLDSCCNEALGDWAQCALPMHLRAFRRHQRQKTA
jgi:hypothetical protein